MPMHDASKPLRVAIVMAGGSGERFWPLSRSTRPKQLLRLTGTSKTMLEEAVLRLAPLIAPQHIYVATGEHLVEPIRAANVGVPPENVIAEPCKRNTAGCLAYATAHLLTKYRPQLPPDAPETQKDLSMAIVTADHLIKGDEAFALAVSAAMDAAEAENALVTIGIPPARPETGYGYIQAPEQKKPLEPYGPPDIFPVTAFHEKPDTQTAEKFLASGRFYWNSGMFFWNGADFMREIEGAEPEYAAAIVKMALAMREGEQTRVREIFQALPPAPIDTVLMEKARKVLVVAAPFTWDDIGAWPALARTHRPDDARNLVIGESVAIDCADCIIYNESEPGSREVAVIGLNDVVVVACDDAVLVASKDRAQDVRDVVAELKKRGSTHV